MGVAEAPLTVRPHDLLRLKHSDHLAGAAPAWVAPALAHAPWAVVRRAVARPGCVAVGVRGATRGQRWASSTPATNCAEQISPEQLLDRVDRLRSDTPAARALTELRHRLQGWPLRWGPTGSAGFELATQVDTLGPDSDLDIVIRGCPDRGLLDQLQRAVSDLPARVDTQLDLDIGAVALDELLSGARELLVKTSTGPSLVPITSVVQGR